MTDTKPSQRKKKGRLAAQIAVTLALVLVISIYFSMLVSAQNVYTITDGDTVISHSSSATEIDQVLAEAGVAVSQNDRISTTSNGNTTEIKIQRSRDVTLNYGGEEISTATYDATVEELLGTLDLSLTEGDTMVCDGRSLSLSDSLHDGMNIDITRTSEETVTETISIPYDSVTFLDPTMEKGTTTVKTAGVEGQQEITYLREYVNGELTQTSTLRTKVLSAPVTEVILIGSGEKLPSEAETAIADAAEEPEEDVTEEAPADSEDTNTEADTSYEEAVDSEPEYEEPEYEEPEYEEPAYEEPEYEEPEYEEPEYEEPEYEEPSYSEDTITTSSGEVLSYVDVLSVEATAYCGGGTTATGTPARYGAIAVDPDVIPYGTKMYIVSDDGKWIYGVATAEDCGGAINGYIIDLYFDDYDTCIQFGRRNCTVYVLEWG